MPHPVKLLEGHLDKKIELVLKDGRKLKGTLKGFDDYMNMVLEETEEQTESSQRRIGTIILRGNNVVTIQPL
ncbi:MAG TPA: RNA-binding protein [Euryarchaeota archaeon]|nr:RNA-binding protein [Euryarchaeota archaeon]